MSNNKNLETRIDEVIASPDMMLEDLVLDVTGEVCILLEKQGVSRSELARRIGVKPPTVTRILQGQDNFTLRTLTRIGHALNMVIRCTFAPMGSTTRFIHSYDGKKESLRVESSEASTERGQFKKGSFGRVVKLDAEDEDKGIGGVA